MDVTDINKISNRKRIYTDAEKLREKVTRENAKIIKLKIQGQIYHRTGSLLPMPDEDYQFLQKYFIGNSAREVDQRCAHNSVKRSIVEQLQTLFHQHNELVALFTTALDRLPSDNHKIIIRADKAPAGQHAGRFNAPTIDEVAIVVVAQDTAYWDLKEKLQQLQESHERLQQNMVDVQMQYEAVSGQYQDELRLRPETLNKYTTRVKNVLTKRAPNTKFWWTFDLMVPEGSAGKHVFGQQLKSYVQTLKKDGISYFRLNCTREICDVLEDYGERVRSSLERCRADQRELSAAYTACGVRVKRLVDDSAEAQKRERNLRDTIRLEHERHDADLRRHASLQEQLGAARARAVELAQRLERYEHELRQREEAAAAIQTKVALLMRDFEKQIGDSRNTITAQEKQIEQMKADIENERTAKIAQEDRVRDAEEHVRVAEEHMRLSNENVSRLHQELGAALEQVRSLDEQREKANATVIHLNNEITFLNNDQRDKEKLITEGNEKVTELQEELSRMKINISQVECEKHELVGQLHQVTSQSQLQTSKVEELTRLVTSLEGTLRETQAANDAQRTADANKIEELNKAVSERDVELNTKTGTINKLMNELKAAATAFDAARKQQETERQQALANVERFEASIRTKDAQLDDQMRLIRDLRTEKEHLRNEKERLLARINDMQATIDNIQKLAGRGPPAPPAPTAPAERDTGVVLRAPDTEMYDFFSDDSDAINAGEVKRRYDELLRGGQKGNVSLAQMKKDLNLKNRIFKNKRQDNKYKKNKG